MSTPGLYLRPDAVAEPLVDRWYARPQLIAPATAALNLVERHVKIMESYVRAPQTHAAALKNPAMRGGPFINYPEPRVDAVAALLEHTRRAREPAFELCRALRALESLLSEDARGASLEPLYPRVPDVLRGYVELVYDLDNRASYRLIEPLLYRSPFYAPDAQSLALSLVDGDHRPFILSTPRLCGDAALELTLPFADPALDRLFSAATEPIAAGELRERLALSAGDDATLTGLMTSTAPPAPPAPPATGVRWRYFGHACVLVETPRVSVLVDPVVSYRFPSDVPRYTFDDLPARIDAVLLTHAHADHVLIETLLRLRHRVRTVVVPRGGRGSLQDPSLALVLRALGFDDVRELDVLQSLALPGGEVVGLPFLGEHGDLDIATKLAYRLTLEGATLMFAADSNNLEPRLYQHVRRQLGPTDALFIGMECDGAPASWIYGPMMSRPLARKDDQSRRLAGSDCARALALADALDCAETYVYAMGQEPWLGYVMSVDYTPTSPPIVESNRFVEMSRARGRAAARLYARHEGGFDARKGR